jgi:uncharacterized membrane protein
MMKETNKDIQDNKLVSIVAYLPILFLIPLFVAKESPFARFHTNQGVLVTIVWAAGAFLLNILPGLIGGLLTPLFGILMLVLFILGVVNVSNGQMKPLPVIGETQIIK